MIGFVIKYFFIDTCINKLFTEIEKKFKNNMKTKPNIGDVFYKISHKLLNEVYYNCVVVDIENIYGHNNEFIVYVKFEKKYEDKNNNITNNDSDEVDKEKLIDIFDDGLEDYYTIDDIDDIDFDIDFDISEDDTFNYITDDVQAIETQEKDVIGLSTIYYNFYKIYDC